VTNCFNNSLSLTTLGEKKKQAKQQQQQQQHCWTQTLFKTRKTKTKRMLCSAAQYVPTHGRRTAFPKHTGQLVELFLPHTARVALVVEINAPVRNCMDFNHQFFDFNAHTNYSQLCCMQFIHEITGGEKYAYTNC
jgi:hypothetical protein